MRSLFAVLAPAAEFLAKLLWSFAKAIFAFIAWMVCVVLVVGLTQELIEAVGLYDYAYDVAHGIHLGVSAVVIIAVGYKLFCWGSGKKWFADISPRLATKSAAPPVARSPAQSLWFFAKAVMALLAWAGCASLVGYWMLWLRDTVTLEGIVADTADGLLCAVWMVGTAMLGSRLLCWVNGETWREFWSAPPDYQRPDYAPESEKSGRG